jgi:hypothetical protein
VSGPKIPLLSIHDLMSAARIPFPPSPQGLSFDGGRP